MAQMKRTLKRASPGGLRPGLSKGPPAGPGGLRPGLSKGPAAGPGGLRPGLSKGPPPGRSRPVTNPLIPSTRAKAPRKRASR